MTPLAFTMGILPRNLQHVASPCCLPSVACLAAMHNRVSLQRGEILQRMHQSPGAGTTRELFLQLGMTLLLAFIIAHLKFCTRILTMYCHGILAATRVWLGVIDNEQTFLIFLARSLPSAVRLIPCQSGNHGVRVASQSMHATTQ
jgi:hypothetical protein